MFNLANLRVSQQQSHLPDNFQAEVIISVWDPYSRVGVCVARDKQQWQDLAPTGTSPLI